MKALRLIAIFVVLMMLAGCQTLEPPASSDLPELASLEPLGTPSSELPKPEPKDADWVIQLDDTQDYVNEDSGFLYHCNLYVYAQKSGGTDVLGDFTGQVVLRMELDLAQLTEIMGEDGLTVDSITGGNVSLETAGAAFKLVKYTAEAYTAGMKEIAPDLPLLQLPDPKAADDAMALELIEMDFRLEAPSGTGHDDGGTVEGWGPGSAQTVSEPIVIRVEGATVYVSFPRYGFDRAFKGTITGNVR